MVIVYVLQSGSYSYRSLDGIYATPERAMADVATRWAQTHPDGPQRDYAWAEVRPGRWVFGPDWDGAADLTAREVLGAEDGMVEGMG